MRSIFVPLAVLPLALLLGACGRQSAREPGLEWNGAPIPVTARQNHPNEEALKGRNLEVLEGHPPKRILEIASGDWGDSLVLLEYPGEEEAYAGFQELAPNSEDLAAYSVHGDRVCFRRGRWIGTLDAMSWKGADGFDRALALPGAPSPGGLPKVFGSLLYRNRIPGSERILTREFLGLKFSSRVFSVGMDCHGDTARLYAAGKINDEFIIALAGLPGWRSESVSGVRQFSSESSEMLPVVLRFTRGGMVAVEGCFDDSLTNYWLKIQARGLKSLK